MYASISILDQTGASVFGVNGGRLCSSAWSTTSARPPRVAAPWPSPGVRKPLTLPQVITICS